MGWESRCGIEDRRLVVHGYRRTAAGRMLWRGREVPLVAGPPRADHDRNERIFTRLGKSFRQNFPQLRDVELAHAWGGPICRTVDCIASVRWVSRARWLYALGYAGHGAGPSCLVGRLAGGLLRGAGSDPVHLPFVSAEPVSIPRNERLRKVGLGVAQKVMTWLDDRDAAGRGYGPLGRVAARFLA